MLAIDFAQPLIWTIDGVLSPRECLAMIQLIEEVGPTAAPVTTEMGPVMMPDVRNNSRVIIEDKDFAKTLFERVKAHIPMQMAKREAVGVNERFRCYKYEPGQYFAPHLDGSFRRDELERSFLTFMIYLNEDFEGGETNFLEMKKSIKPRTGAALLFQHPLLHEGAEVRSGVKYALRSDIMYRRHKLSSDDGY